MYHPINYSSGLQKDVCVYVHVLYSVHKTIYWSVRRKY